jgi:Rrf2 family protein
MPVRLSARGDYAVRAVLELAAADGRSVKLAQIAASQDIPERFLENILVALRRHRLVLSRRGAEGGFRLARPPEEISIADVIRATEGPLANVRGEAPESVRYAGSAAALGPVWIAMRTSLRDVLEHVSVADVVAGTLPSVVADLAARPHAWETR